MLYRGVVGFNQARADLNGSKASLGRYYNAPVFPSLENVKTVNKNARQMDSWFNDLIKRLAAGNVVSNDRSPSHFIAAGNQVRRQLIKKARKAGTELPDAKTNFAFGFERYTGADKALPKSDDIPRLIEQLVIINRITSILFENGIKSITSVKREVFEKTANESLEDADMVSHSSRRGSRSRRRGRSNSSRMKSSSHKVTDVGIIKPGEIYAKMHFVFEFRAKEKSFINIMNAFSTSDMFIVVTSVSISKRTPKLVPPEPTVDVKESDVVDAFDSGVGKNDDKVAKPKLGPDYPVCGIKMEIPMDIHLELDVYKFREAGLDSGN